MKVNGVLVRRTIELGRLLGLVRASGTAEPAAVDAVFRRHGKDVVRIVRRLLGPHAGNADVEDIVQQVFVSVQRDLPRFRGDSAITTWLYGIASRAVFMHLRASKRRTRAMERYAHDRSIDHEPDSNLEVDVARRQEVERVWRALEKLKPKKRMVFVMFEIEGLSGKEIAGALEIKEATVWTRLMHARRELVDELRKDLDR